MRATKAHWPLNAAETSEMDYNQIYADFDLLEISRKNQNSKLNKSLEFNSIHESTNDLREPDDVSS